MAEPRKTPFIEAIATRLTSWVGSTSSIVVHTLLFFVFFLIGILRLAGWDTILLVLTTLVSLEAIYLSIFIQMTVNRNTQSLTNVELDIDELEEDVGEIREDVGEMEEHIGEIREDVEEMSEDVEDIQEDVEEMSEDDREEEARDHKTTEMLDTIEKTVKKLMEDIDKLKTNRLP